MSPLGFAPALLALQFPSLGGGTGTAFIFQFVAIIGIFYFVLIRPQQSQRKKHEEALRAVKRGDQIVTFGGIIAEVVHVKEVEGSNRLDDQVTIRSAESRLVIERGRIARIVGVSASGAKE